MGGINTLEVRSGPYFLAYLFYHVMMKFVVSVVVCDIFISIESRSGTTQRMHNKILIRFIGTV